MLLHGGGRRASDGGTRGARLASGWLAAQGGLGLFMFVHLVVGESRILLVRQRTHKAVRWLCLLYRTDTRVVAHGDLFRPTYYSPFTFFFFSLLSPGVLPLYTHAVHFHGIYYRGVCRVGGCKY